MNNTYDVIIIGAGAAGLMCAIEAGKNGQKVLILEKSEKPGKKILISGGGRCNFTNIYNSSDNFISANPHFHKSALARYTPFDFISLVESYNISYHEKKLGQLFCDGSSRQIVEMLISESNKYDVKIILNCETSNIEKKDVFIVQSDKGVYQSGKLVVATGGPSIPTMGATGFGYKVAKQFGHKIIECRPALVPLTMDKEHLNNFGDLSGVSIDSVAECNGISFRENILFTHRGFSGPAILQISSYWKPGDLISLNLLPDKNFKDEILNERNSKKMVDNFLSGYLPERFAQRFALVYFPAKRIIDLSTKEIEAISDRLHKWELTPIGTEGFAKAEVTVGGVDTTQISSKTMESKLISGLYFIGEVVDVTGWLGGYNFQWAWASGHASGKCL